MPFDHDLRSRQREDSRGRHHLDARHGGGRLGNGFKSHSGGRGFPLTGSAADARTRSFCSRPPFGPWTSPYRRQADDVIFPIIIRPRGNVAGCDPDPRDALAGIASEVGFAEDDEVLVSCQLRGLQEKRLGIEGVPSHQWHGCIFPACKARRGFLERSDTHSAERLDNADLFHASTRSVPGTSKLGSWSYEVY
jgi:hypothetical protein